MKIYTEKEKEAIEMYWSYRAASHNQALKRTMWRTGYTKRMMLLLLN